MATEHSEGNEGSIPPIRTIDEFVESLGPVVIEPKTDQANEEEMPGTLRFWLSDVTPDPRPGQSSIAEYLLRITPGKDPVTDRKILQFHLQARFAEDDGLEDLADLSEIDAFDSQQLERLAGGFTTESLRSGGYDALAGFITRDLLHDDFVERQIVTVKDKALGQRVKKKYFDHEAEQATIAELTEKFRAEFPTYSNTDALKEDNVFLFAEPGEDGLAPYIRIYQASNGFSVEYGKATLKQNRNRGTIIDKKPVKDWNAPLARSETPDIDRSWDFWEVGEAIEVLKLRQQELVVDDAFLDQPASWLDSEGRVATFREMIGYWAGQGLMSDKSLAGLAVEGATKIPLPRALSEEQLRVVASARLSAGDEQSHALAREITDLEVREEFRKIETAATRLIRGKGYFITE